MGNHIDKHKIDNINIIKMAFQMKCIWKRKFVELPVSKDLPRLCKNVIIYDKEEVLHKHNDEDFLQLLFLIFLTLTKKTKDFKNPYKEFEVLTFENFQKEVDIADNQTINQFVTKHYEESSKTIQILKLLNQSLIAPAVTQIKQVLLGKLEYKDVQGSWVVEIFCLDQKYKVIHKKKEQVIKKVNNKYENLYQFQWSLNIELKELETGLEVDNISVHLVQCLFNQVEMTNEEKQIAEKMLEDALKGLSLNLNDEVYQKEEKILEKVEMKKMEEKKLQEFRRSQREELERKSSNITIKQSRSSFFFGRTNSLGI